MILSRNQPEIKSRERTKSKMLDKGSHHGAILLKQTPHKRNTKKKEKKEKKVENNEKLRP